MVSTGLVQTCPTRRALAAQP